MQDCFKMGKVHNCIFPIVQNQDFKQLSVYLCAFQDSKEWGNWKYAWPKVSIQYLGILNLKGLENY